MNRDHSYLRHIRDAARRILDYTREGHGAFMAGPLVQDAVARNIEVIGEATRNLSEALKAAHPAIPWRAIANMRNTLIHRYFDVKLELVWQVVEQDLPALLPQVEAILATFPSGNRSPVSWAQLRMG